MAIKKGSSNDFYAMFNSLAEKHKFPARVMFELTYKCNFKCVHCYVAPDRRKKELTTEQVFLIFDQLKEAGVFHIGFTGGEPFLRKDIFDIFDYAKNCGFRISIFTNGYLINKNIAKRIASLGTSLNRIDVSVLGATKKTFEKITGKRNSFSPVMRALQWLREEKLVVQIKTILLSLNKHEFLKIKKLAEREKCLIRYSQTLSRKTDGSISPLQYQVEPSEIYKIRNILAADNGGARVELQANAPGRKSLFRCGAGKTEVTINPYGEINFCPEIHYPAYNILKTSFNQCWGKLKKLAEDIEMSQKLPCRRCSLAAFCHWCPAKAWLLRKDFFVCDEESKKMALKEAELAAKL